MVQAQTTVSIDGTQFLINGLPTYRGRDLVEGLLFNVRTVNATFDDTLGRVDWWDDDGSQLGNDDAGYGKWTSPDSAFANTERYIQALPEYRAHGILGVNLNVQGGHPLNGKLWFKDTPRPIATNEAHGERAFDALLRRGVSFGLHSTCFQTMYPPRWGIWENETTWFLNKVRALTVHTGGGGK